MKKETTALLKIIRQSDAMVALLRQINQKENASVKGLIGALRTLLLIALQKETGRQVVYFCLNKEDAEEIKEDVERLAPDLSASYFPKTLFFSSSYEQMNHDTLKARLSTLEAISEKQTEIIVSDATGLFKRLPAPQEYGGKKAKLEIATEVDFEALIEELVKLGFTREARVEHPGEMCVRGGIIDLFPYSSERPYRVEFWEDQIESIRLFDPLTQRSLEQLDALTVYPQEIEHLSDTELTAQHASLLDYLSQDAFLVLDDLDLIFKYLKEDLLGYLHGSDAQELADSTIEKISIGLDAFQRVQAVALGSTRNAINFDAKTPTRFDGKLSGFKAYCESISLSGLPDQTEPPNIFFSCENKTQADRLRQLFLDEDIQFSNLRVAPLGLHKGFVFPDANLIIYTEHEFYGRVKRLRLPRKQFKGITPRELKHLNRGDYVVHVDYGVGVFRGLKKVSVHGHERECLQIEYKDKDIVYVRIERMDRVNKYSSKNSGTPHLNKLGSPEWQRAKARTKKKIKDIAKDLIEIYAKRKARPGFSFSEDTLWQRELEVSFPYEDTPDQVKATIEVKKDMESPKPMDRLICGDVGFGKTEIAVRAAFKAVLSEKQVAVLVPTTILAYQHYNTFRERLSNFAVNIEMLSRFRTRAEQKVIIEKLQTGEIDIVIGTHRLLSRDIAFKRFGLLIVDEEHRFGVSHKEKLKKYRANIDVLTLTATPIPRTLKFSLLGARDMTHITTPPNNRLPIITEILPYNRSYIREVILREIERGGQIFFVHNRVRSIERVARMVSEIVPEADIAVAHGQLNEKELEKVMVEFVNREYQILVSTMIIESGLDMPNVNTIIVNRADKLGLAQLYQLRGRVGRSDQRAYAYFIIPPIENLTEDALKRLRAIEEFSEIGSGSQLAMRDLEIRGAGNLLGAEQTGFIDTLGFDLYNKILEEAVEELKQEKLPHTQRVVEVDTQVEMDFDAYLPEDYISSGADRVDVYRRLTESRNVAEIDDIEEEIRDRFGRLPLPVKTLFNFVKVRLLGKEIGFEKIRILDEEMIAVFSQKRVSQQGEHFQKWLGSMISSITQRFEFFQNEALGIRLPFLDSDSEKMNEVTDFLKSLQNNHNPEIAVHTAQEESI